MFSLAMKNAILMILIILIIHFLIKNYLLCKTPNPKQPIKVVQPSPTVENDEDEEELYKFVFKQCDTSLNKPLPPPFNNNKPAETFVQQDSELLGSFNKNDYSKFGSPIS